MPLQLRNAYLCAVLCLQGLPDQDAAPGNKGCPKAEHHLHNSRFSGLAGLQRRPCKTAAHPVQLRVPELGAYEEGQIAAHATDDGADHAFEPRLCKLANDRRLHDDLHRMLKSEQQLAAASSNVEPHAGDCRPLQCLTPLLAVVDVYACNTELSEALVTNRAGCQPVGSTFVRQNHAVAQETRQEHDAAETQGALVERAWLELHAAAAEVSSGGSERLCASPEGSSCVQLSSFWLSSQCLQSCRLTGVPAAAQLLCGTLCSATAGLLEACSPILLWTRLRAGFQIADLRKVWLWRSLSAAPRHASDHRPEAASLPAALRAGQA